MKKQLVIKVNGKEKHYKLAAYNNKFFSYYDNGGVFSSWSEFGESKNLDDAITLCKAHAGSGAVVVKIKDL